jgi:hypothetical protein
MSDPILQGFLAWRRKLDGAAAPSGSLDQALRLIEAGARDLRALQQLAPGERKSNHSALVREHALAIGGAAYRLLRDLHLETAADAAEKDIPF